MCYRNQFQSITSSIGKASSSSAGAASGTSASKTFAHGDEKPPPVCKQFCISFKVDYKSNPNFYDSIPGEGAF